jgi:hypothetical protein
MRPRSIIGVLLFVLGACGGTTGAAPRGPEEVTATWTTGDDAPLEGGGQTPKSGYGPELGRQPGGPKT